jgi:hypothetical protein
MNESIHGERSASEPQDRVIELIGQQTAISEVLRAIASSPRLAAIFDAILDSTTSIPNGLDALRLRRGGPSSWCGDPLLVSQVWSLASSRRKGSLRID